MVVYKIPEPQECFNCGSKCYARDWFDTTTTGGTYGPEGVVAVYWQCEEKRCHRRFETMEQLDDVLVEVEELPETYFSIYNRRLGHDMAILSAKYGLIDAEMIIEPYNVMMTENRAKELVLQVTEKIKDYDVIAYYRGRAGKEYFDCISEACEIAGKKLISVGYKMMGDINELPGIIQRVESLRLCRNFHKHASACFPQLQ